MSIVHRTSATAVVLVLVAALLATAPGPVDAAFPGQNGRIVYFRQTNNNNTESSEIFTMKPDGTDRTRLTSDSIEDADPAASKSGRWIVWERDLGGNQEIFKMRMNGSGRDRLTTSPASVDDTDPAWSPNGQKIVFVSEDSGPDAVYIMNANGNNPEPITQPVDAEDGNPQWSPNGNWIVFDRLHENSVDFDERICLVRPNGDDEHCITGSFFADTEDADWSPDSSKVVFEGRPAGDPCCVENVYRINRNGNGRRRLTDRAEDAGDPAYSPSGGKILFELKNEAPNRLMRMNPDGSNETGVTPANYDVQDPDWSPKP
jgi:Tol biopolymer transport system component